MIPRELDTEGLGAVPRVVRHVEFAGGILLASGTDPGPAGAHLRGRGDGSPPPKTGSAWAAAV